MKNKNTSGFSIVMALLLTIVMVLLVLYILEYIIPYSKNVKSIENSSNAFYQAESGVEDTLFKIKNRADITDESNKSFNTSAVDYKYATTSSGSEIPPAGEGNSEFDEPDFRYNTISAGDPIQLEVDNTTGLNWSLSSTEVIFKVPQINGITNLNSGPSDPTDIINWQLSSTNDTLNASGSWITAAEINGGNGINMNLRTGQNLDGGPDTFGSFFSTECGTSCTLKFSVINELKDGTKTLPYLEYQITTNTAVPLRYSRIKADGKSYGFQKHLEVRVPQQTTNQAFDFTVFQ